MSSDYALMSVQVAEAQAEELPAGWTIEMKGRNRVYVSPDGLTRFSTLAKVQRWHRQQMALASSFQAQAQQTQQHVAREARAAARVVGSPGSSPKSPASAARDAAERDAAALPSSPTRRADWAPE